MVKVLIGRLMLSFLPSKRLPRSSRMSFNARTARKAFRYGRAQSESPLNPLIIYPISILQPTEDSNHQGKELQPTIVKPEILGNRR